MRVGVRVALHLVVVVGGVRRHQAVHQLLQVADPARLVLDQPDGGGRVGDEHVHDAVVGATGLDHLLHTAGDVDDVPVSLGGHAELGAVDGHRQTPYPALPPAFRS